MGLAPAAAIGRAKAGLEIEARQPRAIETGDALQGAEIGGHDRLEQPLPLDQRRSRLHRDRLREQGQQELAQEGQVIRDRGEAEQGRPGPDQRIGERQARLRRQVLEDFSRVGEAVDQRRIEAGRHLALRTMVAEGRDDIVMAGGAESDGEPLASVTQAERDRGRRQAPAAGRERDHGLAEGRGLKRPAEQEDRTAETVEFELGRRCRRHRDGRERKH